jgi:hypothetical protein
MLANSYSIYSQIKSQYDLYDINRVIHSFDDCKSDYSGYITSGYYIYDIIANGGLSYLSALSTASGGGYVLACYKSLYPAYPSSGTHTGTQATAATSNSFYLAGTASTADDFYNGQILRVVSSGGAITWNAITDYTGATKKCTVGAQWTTNPTTNATYTLGDTDYIETEDVTRFNNLVLMGVKLNSYNQPVDYMLTEKLIVGSTATNEYYNEKLTFKYARVYLDTYKENTYGFPGAHAVNDIVFDNCNLYIKSTGTLPNSVMSAYNWDMTNNNLYFDTNAGEWNFIGTSSGTGYATSGLLEWTNNAVLNYSTASAQYIYFVINSSQTLELTNAYFSGNSSQSSMAITTTVSSSNRYTTLNNVLLNNVTVASASEFTYTAGYNKFNYTGTVQINALQTNAIFTRVPDYFQVIDNSGLLTLDVATIMSTSNYARLDCIVSQINQERITPAGKVLRNYYNLNFLPDFLCNSSDFKEIGVNDIMVIERTEENEAFQVGGTSAHKIKNLQIYYSSDMVTLYPFKKNENFFIVAETTQTNASSTQAILMWYNGEVRSTVFDNGGISGWLPDVWYNIKYCFQLWEVQNDNGSGFRATVKDSTSSPIERNLSVNNLDNEYTA